MQNLCVVVDNDFNFDERVRRETNLLSEKFKIHVVCYGYKGVEYPEIKGIKFHRIWVKRKTKKIIFPLFHFIPIFSILWSQKILKVIQSENISKIHAHDLYMSRIVHNAITKSKREVQFVLDLHENFPEAILTYKWTKGFLRQLITRPYYWNKHEKDLLNLPQKVIVLSETFKNYLLSKYKVFSRDKFVVIPNVLDENMLNTPSLELKLDFGNSFVFFYFGINAERRGSFTLIRAFNDLIEENKKLDAKLLIIGPIDNDDKETFYKLSNHLIEKKKIHYIPWIDIRDLNNYMKLCKVGVAPFVKDKQHESGIANKIYQYMYGELALLVSDCEPQKKLVESENIGLVFKNENIVDLKNKMMLLINNEIQTKQFGKNARIVQKQKYNITLYKDLLISCFN